MLTFRRCLRFTLPFVFSAFLLAPPAFAQDPATPVEDTPLHRAKVTIDYSSRETIGPGVTLAQLSSGLTVIVRENHAAPVATVRSYVTNTGSAFEGKYLGAGLSHVLEHLVSGGSNTKRKEVEIQAILDSLGGRTNAYTSSDITAYYIDCPADRVEIAIELVADSMQFVTFDPVEYAREMGVVQRELEMGEADRDRVNFQAMKKLIFTEHPMRHPTIGYLPVLQRVSREEIAGFYRDRYVPQNITFVVVGDVETDEVLAEVLENFSNFHRTTERGVVLADEPPQASARSTRIEMEGETTKLSVAWPTVRLQHPDLYPLDVASYLLTNGDSSRLERRLRVEQPLAISVASASYTPGFVRGWLQVTVDCAPENLEECQRIIFEEVYRLAEGEIREEELAKVKRQKAAEHVFGQQTVQSQAEALGRSYLSTGDPLFDEQYVEGIQAVTAEQVRDVARRYFRPERLNTVIIEPLGGSAGRVAKSPAQIGEADVVRKQLPNGLTVLLKRHSVLPMVNVQAFVKAGVLSDTQQTRGRAALASDLMAKGTQKYSAEQIAGYFDSIGGTLSMDSQRNTSFVQCSVLKDDFPRSLDYIYQVLYQPTFPQDEFLKRQKLQLGQIAARRANPQTEILDYWTRLLPDDGPYGSTVLGTPETVAKLSVEECRRWHRTHFAPQNMVLAVFGDIDVEATLASIEATFGREKQTAFKFPEFPPTHETHPAVRENLPSERPNTAMIVMGYPTVSVYDEEARGALELLNGILTGGGGSGGRLFFELRGERLVYYVFGFEMTGLAPGYFIFMVQTRPDTADEVIERIQKALDKIRAEGIPADEFEAAREKLIAGHKMSNTTASSQAFQAAIDELYGFGYQYDKTYEDRIRKVTVEDVQNVVTKYFRQPIIATSMPEAAK